MKDTRLFGPKQSTRQLTHAHATHSYCKSFLIRLAAYFTHVMRYELRPLSTWKCRFSDINSPFYNDLNCLHCSVTDSCRREFNNLSALRTNIPVLVSSNTTIGHRLTIGSVCYLARVTKAFKVVIELGVICLVVSRPDLKTDDPVRGTRIIRQKVSRAFISPGK